MHLPVLFMMLTVSIQVDHSTISFSEALASVIPPRVDELEEESELIVLARVESVSGGPEDEDRRAKATVLEVWKGPKTTSVEYRISPTFACDIAKATKGETVLLFLRKERTGWGIAWAGRGRMPIVNINDIKYTSFFSDVIFPDETPRVRAEEADGSGFEQAVELRLVKELVQKATEQKRKEDSPSGKRDAK
ncbi:hypothetical protein [Paludisphaera mucosa]|uniref:Uncharacterized protein n=1 Tax=Paludisphaera mucosa TaxID=3030827 RepID=A0ABT6FAJ2_9BACT|nr:hypothetical protein [Paludisphaera mucosa]MDG3004599.1 hypothetical protein [Paludisphaera mucosa]